MRRDAVQDVTAWLQASTRRPLVIRGARQVGKTWLVRECARLSGRRLIELNVERDPGLAPLFRERDPRLVIRALEAYRGERIAAEESMLFLDEIQAAPQILATLRWFAEEWPAFPVVTAGSLLDFALADPLLSMPVGRVSYLYLEPLSFDEFLSARGQEGFREFIADWQPLTPIPEPLHQRGLEFFREYLLVGGMPGVVAAWCADPSWVTCAEMQQALITTLRDDFAKYTGRVPRPRLDKILDAVPRLLGRKFMYSHIDREERTSALRQALDLLCRARVCHTVQACDGVGLPLGAGVRERAFKVMLLDVGLVSALLGLSLHAIPTSRDVFMVNEGALLEQAAGQLLRTIEPRFVDPRLYYWIRERKGAAAELDYLIQHRTTIVPIEVKAGTTGTLKSLHLFMALRTLPIAVRFNADTPSITPVDLKTTTGDRAVYRLFSVPFYLIGHLHRLLDQVPG